MTTPSPIVPITPDRTGLKIWSAILHVAAVASGIALGVLGFDWITR